MYDIHSCLVSCNVGGARIVWLTNIFTSSSVMEVNFRYAISYYDSELPVIVTTFASLVQIMGNSSYSLSTGLVIFSINNI